MTEPASYRGTRAGLINGAVEGHGDGTLKGTTLEAAKNMYAQSSRFLMWVRDSVCPRFAPLFGR